MTMTRTQAIAIITAQLATLDDERVLTVADFLQDIAAAEPLSRELTPGELALIAQSKDDFRSGRTLTPEQAHARTDAFIADRRAVAGKA